jgi:hypothetical protein
MSRIRERVDSAARRSGRTGEDITIVVVTKNRSVEEIKAALAAGVRDIGENRVQEALGKRPALTEKFTFRLIGHLQRNKAADAVRIFDAVDSVDSIRLGRKLSEELVKDGKNMPALVQVNSSAEETKHGFEPEEIIKAAAELNELPGLELRGLMTIGPLTDDEKEIRGAFRMARDLYDGLRKEISGFDVLSMGMSDDFETAIEEGSNMVRIGRAVFEGR